MEASAKKMLIYGATGKAGRLVMKRALETGWGVVAFVRNPDRVPADLRAKVTVVTGDLCDAAAVSAAVRSARPDAIVDASSMLPFGHQKGQPANDADRSIFTKATVDALEADERLDRCVMVIIGGQLLPEPGGTIEKSSVAALAWVIRNVARKTWSKAEAWINWCFQEAPPAFRFVYARLGQMVEEPSRGTLNAEKTEANIQRGSASYCDVADALVRLADDPARTWERKALYFNYARTA